LTHIKCVKLKIKASRFSYHTGEVLS